VGRAGAARPSSPSNSLVLPGPSTRASGSTTTTQSGRGSRPDGSPHGAVRTRRASTSSPALAQSPATGALAAVWPPGSVGRSLPRRTTGQIRGRRSPQKPDGLDTRRAGHQTAGHQTAGHLDPGRRNGWVDTRMPDADRRWTPWQASGIPTTVTTPLPLGCCPEAPPGRRRLGRSATGQLSRRDTAKGRSTAATRQLQATAATGRLQSHSAVQPVHCCRVLELEGTRGGQWDYGR
jgi:hypothetical protein